MSGIFEALNNGFVRFMNNAARNRLRNDLLARNDRLLEDIGVSRELLEEGVGAFPWRVADLPADGLKLVSGARMSAQAGSGKGSDRADVRDTGNIGNLRAA